MTPNEPPLPTEATFASILRSSLERDFIFKSTCQTCKLLANHRVRRVLSSQSMPPLLAVNATVNNDDHLKFWLGTRRTNFLSPQVRIDMRSPEGELKAGSAEAVMYDLRVRRSF